MSEPEMVERVRAAILEAMRAHGESEYVGETGRAANLTSIDGDFDMAAIARAAIEAMREPTPEMVDAGGYACQAHCDLTMDAARKSWAEMIDAALAEPTAPR